VDTATGGLGWQGRAAVPYRSDDVEKTPQNRISDRYRNGRAGRTYLRAARETSSRLKRNAANGHGVDVAVHLEDQRLGPTPFDDQGSVDRRQCLAGEAHVYDGASHRYDRSRRRQRGHGMSHLLVRCGLAVAAVVDFLCARVCLRGIRYGAEIGQGASSTARRVRGMRPRLAVPVPDLFEGRPHPVAALMASTRMLPRRGFSTIGTRTALARWLRSAGTWPVIRMTGVSTPSLRRRSMRSRPLPSGSA
jgi:hypothetical protein